MIIYIYKLTLDNGEESYAFGQMDHENEIELIECSQPVEVPDASGIDDIIKMIKCCQAKQNFKSH